MYTLGELGVGAGLATRLARFFPVAPGGMESYGVEYSGAVLDELAELPRDTLNCGGTFMLCCAGVCTKLELAVEAVSTSSPGDSYSSGSSKISTSFGMADPPSSIGLSIGVTGVGGDTMVAGGPPGGKRRLGRPAVLGAGLVDEVAGGPFAVESVVKAGARAAGAGAEVGAGAGADAGAGEGSIVVVAFGMSVESQEAEAVDMAESRERERKGQS